MEKINETIRFNLTGSQFDFQALLKLCEEHKNEQIFVFASHDFTYNNPTVEFKDVKLMFVGSRITFANLSEQSYVKFTNCEVYDLNMVFEVDENAYRRKYLSFENSFIEGLNLRVENMQVSKDIEANLIGVVSSEIKNSTITYVDNVNYELTHVIKGPNLLYSESSKINNSRIFVNSTIPVIINVDFAEDVHISANAFQSIRVEGNRILKTTW